MRPTLVSVTVAVLLGLATPAASGDAVDECDGPTAVMAKCVWDHYDAADRELNEVWKAALATIQPSDDLPADKAKEWKDHLIAAQRAWATFKEEDCNGAVAYEWFGGTGANSAVGTCLYEHTRARVDDLKARYLSK